MENAKKWFENFWYHYKWHTIFTLFGVMSLILVLVTIFNNKTDDLYIVYGGKYITGSEAEGVNSAFVSILDENFDKNDDLTVNFSHLPYVAGDFEDLTGEERKLNYDADQYLQNQLLAGNYYIFILEKQLYERFNDNDPSIFVPISKLFDEKIDDELLYDEWGIYFKKLDFYKNSGVDALDGDLIICLANPTEGFMASLFDKDTNEKFEYHKNVFIDIVTFGK